MMLSDKMGEIGFINVNNIHNLPTQIIPNKPNSDKEEEKKEDDDEKHLPPFEDNGVYKTLYGHQETCLDFHFNGSVQNVLSYDTLKKVSVTNFPNVFNMQSVMLEHTKDIKSACFLGDDKVASLSAPDSSSNEQDLFISAVSDGRVISHLKVNGSEADSLAPSVSD